MTKLPHDQEIESKVLGKMLNCSTGLSVGLEQLQVEDFYFSNNQAIFQILRELSHEDSAITTGIVYQKLKESEDLKKYADIKYLIQIQQYFAVVGDDIKFFCDILKELKSRRLLIALSQNVLSEASNMKVEPEEIQGQIMDGLDKIFVPEAEENTFAMGELLRAKAWDDNCHTILEHIQFKQEQAIRGDKTLSGISTGYPRLDAMLDGINKGHFIIVAARSGSGKSTLMANLIYNMLLKNVNVFVQSMEMTATELVEKIVFIGAGVSTQKKKNGTINSTEFQSIAESVAGLEKKNMVIDQSDGLTVGQFCAKIRRLVKSQPIDVIFLDYITRLSADKKYNSREEEVQYISKRLCHLAKTLKVPIICLAQLNRQNEINGRAPRKSDLRESGQIEADAHSIIMIHRPWEFDKSANEFTTELHIVKNRFGPSGKIEYQFYPETGTYMEFLPVRQEIQKVVNSYV